MNHRASESASASSGQASPELVLPFDPDCARLAQGHNGKTRKKWSGDQ